MQGFQSKIASVLVSDGRNVTLAEPITYIANDGSQYVCPRGATSDGCSTPPELWPLLPPFGTYWLAAVLHDCAYRNTLLMVNPQGTSQSLATLSKEDCDSLFKEAMESLGVEQATVEKIYWGVRLGGWSSFDKDRS